MRIGEGGAGGGIGAVPVEGEGGAGGGIGVEGEGGGGEGGGIGTSASLRAMRIGEGGARLCQLVPPLVHRRQARWPLTPLCDA